MASFQTVFVALCFAAAQSTPTQVESPDGKLVVTREKFFQDWYGYANPADAPNELSSEDYEAVWEQFVKKFELGEVNMVTQSKGFICDLLDGFDDNWRYVFFPIAYGLVGWHLWQSLKDAKSEDQQKAKTC